MKMCMLLFVLSVVSGCVKSQQTSVETEPVEEKIFAATATTSKDDKLLHDITCMWYFSDNAWHALIFKGTEFVNCHSYVTREELVQDITKKYVRIPMDKSGEVVLETIGKP